MNLGWTEILLLLGLALLLFGPSRLPGLGKSMGEAIRGFKKGISDQEDVPPARDVNEHLDQPSQSAQGQNKKEKEKQGHS
jgi:sec-independent protein translocase protein TatA